ncbi:hypothetical protein CLAFUW4_04193 [Fulvia fulva]|uniref:Uncharacterized protein n=1 Tax=Passalora fulva TaxID=5499 RepID=A0A9Q8P7R8_PASFU|nr:uncharacterized protein CLAFUR5_04156 [Fulvia fulva]KAK4627189.1 hypothetical protein CLAFUR4_04179 [Fulvia fulva]KAK4627554.1 hypothetical protein CLAFUR0_04179 [Fulvia fulva]UJO16157.1 hypothetical protein CLAFUR5_04156 [Fulvia fulva]WPV14248.1 hypothetical protein CLAFUW4_04193 [Fulvia fulva]WPV28383.1 hypothetical protein CLAFUW7_04182 [Fulvia fulva]
MLTVKDEFVPNLSSVLLPQSELHALKSWRSPDTTSTTATQEHRPQIYITKFISIAIKALHAASAAHSPPYHHRCANETRHLHHQCTHLHQMVYTRQQATITEGTSRSAITNMAPSASLKPSTALLLKLGLLNSTTCN